VTDHQSPVNRRAFVAGSTAFAVATGLRGTRTAFAQTSPRRIDVHNHVMPPDYLKAGRAKIIETADLSPDGVLNWTPQTLLAEMDRTGVATAVLSVSTPGIWLFGNREQTRRLARSCNEYSASLIARYPGRFGMFAAMPLPYVDDAVAEAVYALDVLKADGIGLLTSYGNRYLGDPAFASLFAELNRRKTVVFVHPTTPACCATLLPHINASVGEYMFDITRTLMSLLFSGTFSKFADIRFIFTHAGGTMTPISGRINAYGARHHELDAIMPNGVYYELKKLHYDIANSTNSSAMAALMNLVPATQILFGSDTPYVPIATTAGGLDHMTLDDDVRFAIDRGNALRLFPRLSAAT
jgi:predicted TIM-barrel fold metal-dependent hydrolase